MFFLLAWGGGGGFFGGGGNSTREGELTRAEMYNALGQQDSFSNQSNIMRELSAFERDATNNWGSMKYDNLMGVNSIMSQMAANAAAQAQCCCETNRNIDAVRYENARNTCDIVNAIKADGDATRALMTQNEIQSLRDQLQTANFQLSQQAQNATLISTLRPTPIPAYQTCSPYESAHMFSHYGTVCNNGCGC